MRLSTRPRELAAQRTLLKVLAPTNAAAGQRERERVSTPAAEAAEREQEQNLR